MIITTFQTMLYMYTIFLLLSLFYPPLSLSPSLHTHTHTHVVPDPVEDITVIPFGPRHIYMAWSNLNQTQLRGPISRKTFTVLINSRSLSSDITPDTNLTIVNSSLLQPNTTHSFGVLVSNGVLSSQSRNVVDGTTWPLPPLATISEVTNNSLEVNVTLQAIHSVLEELRLCINVSTLSLYCMYTDVHLYMYTCRYTILRYCIVYFLIKNIFIEKTNVQYTCICIYTNVHVYTGTCIVYACGYTYYRG